MPGDADSDSEELLLDPRWHCLWPGRDSAIRQIEDLLDLSHLIIIGTSLLPVSSRAPSSAQACTTHRCSRPGFLAFSRGVVVEQYVGKSKKHQNKQRTKYINKRDDPTSSASLPLDLV